LLLNRHQGQMNKKEKDKKVLEVLRSSIVGRLAER
jgi:hypothetical protein